MASRYDSTAEVQERVLYHVYREITEEDGLKELHEEENVREEKLKDSMAGAGDNASIGADHKEKSATTVDHKSVYTDSEGESDNESLSSERSFGTDESIPELQSTSSANNSSFEMLSDCTGHESSDWIFVKQGLSSVISFSLPKIV